MGIKKQYIKSLMVHSMVSGIHWESWNVFSMNKGHYSIVLFFLLLD
jgi:hypothetical protein